MTQRLKTFSLCALGYIAVLAVLFFLRLPFNRHQIWMWFTLQGFSTIVVMMLVFAVIFSYADLRLKPLKYAGLAALFALGVAAMFFIAAALIHGGVPAFREVSRVTTFYSGPLRIPINLFQILAAASLGCFVSGIVKDKGLLLAVVLVAACTDVWTVFAGPVGQALEKIPQAATATSASLPVAGMKGLYPLAIIGVGDSLFTGLVAACVAKFGLNMRRNYIFVSVFMTLAMLSLMIFWTVKIPALVVLSVAVVCANFGEFRLKPAEKRDLAIAFVLFALVLGVISLAMRR
ncbi:MAG: hypothetical protein J6332_04970 [Abditibacteriota bacterium]|nr:hypothetical protein [Abditibacteriota bacterium]